MLTAATPTTTPVNQAARLNKTLAANDRPTIPTCVLRTGCISTSLTTTATSLPEKPSVLKPNWSNSACTAAVEGVGVRALGKR
jgi:hypothetical protein